jgi:DNA-3-methyladenine glycosylase
MQKLPKSFFLQPTINVAQQLLGKLVVHQTDEGLVSGKIVETEAYLADDPASHSFRGQTKRNLAMFGDPGTAYLYFTYGMHYCFNVVTADHGVGEAVLIRSLEPKSGIQLMKLRRGREKLLDLCSGPAKLVQALGLGLQHNGVSLDIPPLFLTQEPEDYQEPQSFSITKTTRIGITLAQDKQLRYFISNNRFVSQQ